MDRPPPSLPARLAEVVGAAHVLEDPDVTAGYCADWTGRYRGSTPAVVRPGSAAEVAGLISVCRDLGVALVPLGGNTGLVGGAVPLDGEVVVSLRRLAEVGPVDQVAGQVTAGAGATIAGVQRAAGAAGWAYGVDFGSRDSATVGGSVATAGRLLRNSRSTSCTTSPANGPSVMRRGTRARRRRLCISQCSSVA